MNLKFKLFLLLFCVFISQNAISSIISGTITDEEGKPLPFVSVFVKNSTTGVSANLYGKYFLELQPGNYTLIYSYIGYEKLEKRISVTQSQHLKINIKLREEINSIDEVEIVADKIDRAKSIMANVRKNRKMFVGNIKNFKCDIYTKTSFEKEFTPSDTLKRKEIKADSIDVDSTVQKAKLNLIEYLAESYYMAPNKFKEKIYAYQDCSDKRPPGRSISITVDIDDGGGIAPRYFYATNPYLFETNNLSNTFNFYKTLLDIPQLCNQPLKSPIAKGSALNYKYEYIESFFENDVKIYKIKVTPINKNEALFYGNIFIEDSTWALIALDLSINERSLIMHQNFRIIENYKRIDDNIYLPVKLNINYTIKDGKENVLGETKIIYQDYIVNTDSIHSKIFNNEVRTFESDAQDKDSVYWSINRKAELKTSELEFIAEKDSIRRYYQSHKFFDKQDSIFNRFHWYSPLIGYGRKNHYKGTEYLVGGLIQQIVPFGVGGYRHRLPFYFNKEFSNAMLLVTNCQIDYGFKNKDIKGKFGVGLTYYPKKFIRTFVEVGNTYDFINNYASVEQIFSRSNYVNTKSIEIRQKAEVFNGLFAELSMFYSDQIPIVNVELAKWSDFLFGDLNNPTDFERYTKSELKLTLQYRIKQKFMIRGNKKIILGDDYPELFFTYRKGIPKIFNSEVNFDYIEFGAKAEHQLARFGNSRWKAMAGMFTNKSNLRLLEYKYFRGSDLYFFSDPMRSFQLLGPTLNTNYSFWQANYMHHFNGTILNKIPGINRLKISIAGGAGALSIPEDNFYHFEMFAGFEKIIRIKDEMYRIGIYGVTSDNSLSNAEFTFKIGFSFFNSYNKKWSY